MENIRDLLAELKLLMGKTDMASEARREEIAQTIKMRSEEPGVKEAFETFIDEGITEVESNTENLRKQIERGYELLPVSYIAKHYFGKSRAWLYQRLSGYKVRGQVYTLNEEQKKIFNRAVQDIARQIGSLHLA